MDVSECTGMLVIPAADREANLTPAQPLGQVPRPFPGNDWLFFQKASNPLQGKG